MTIFSKETACRIRSVLVNVMKKPEMAIPVTDDHTIYIESQRAKPVNRTWHLRVTLTTTLMPENVEDNPYVYLHEVNDEGQAFVDAWTDLIEDIPWLTDHSWNFMLSKVYNCGDDVAMATYSERVKVNAEDVLESVVGDDRLVRVSYTVPREMFVVVDEDVDLDEPSDVISEVPNLGYKSVPVVDLEPEMMRTSLSPYDSPNIPTAGLDDVEDVSVEVVESEYEADTEETPDTE